MVTINDVIAFIEKAISNKYTMCAETYITKFCKYEFRIEHGDKFILFLINSDEFEIIGPYNSLIKIKHTLTERERLALESLMIDIKDLNENKTLSLFNNFFNDNSQVTINDLDNEDD